MKKDKETQESTPSKEDGTQEKDNASVETKGTESEEIEVKPSQNDDENGTSEVVIDESSQEENDKSTSEQPVRRNIPAEVGKISKLEKQVNELSQYQKDLELINRIYQDDPKAYEAFRQGYIKQTGQDLGSYETRFGAQTAQPQGQTQAVNQPEQPTNPITPQAIEVFRKIARRDRENEEGFKEFIKNIPEMDPSNFKSEEDYKRAETTWNTIGPVADKIRDNLGISAAQALIKAYYLLPENEGKQIREAKDEARLVGRAEAYAQGTGSDNDLSTGQSGARMGTGKTVKLDEEQMKVYRRFKEDGRDDLAKRYARNIANS
jgi:hypothetical protein